ncbi:MAG: molybdopterin-dependent oxidoreductase [Deltaproteobacteria bacterium]|nr:molybdopterin-dependent oxidoreductase [Deltaproteobacteria bacterium]
MPKLEIDGREVTVEDGLNLIQAAERLGIEVPHYCYHPGLSISGNCRMCLVEIEKMPRLQIACNTRVTEGMVVKTTSPKVKTAQAAVLEFLLINHPIDCPVCDQAGECKLQDYYMDYGAYRSRFPLEAKVEKRKVVDLGPQVILDQERCILCARCTRFLDEVTKTSELGIFARGDHCYIDLFPGKKLDNPYSGNVVDVCPVGALTSKDFRFKARVWYLEKVESICTMCANGCNIDIYHRRGQMYRFRPRYNPDVNQYWMCDEGRLWYKELQKESRLFRPLMRGEPDFTPVTWDKALASVVETLTRVKAAHGAGAIAGIVGAKATNEEVYLFARLLKEQLGAEQVTGLSWSPADAFHDNFLIKADKNPNTRGLQALGLLNGGASAAAVLAAAEKGTVKVLLVFGVDLVTVFGQKKADAALSNVDVIVLDTDYTGTTEYANMVLPISAAPETDGTFTNYAGRVQRVRQAFPPPGEAKPGWEALSLLAAKLGGTEHLSSAEVFAELAKQAPAFSGLTYGKLGSRGALLPEVAQPVEPAAAQV